MATTLTLDAVHRRGDVADTFDLRLRFPAGSFDGESQLVITSVMRLAPAPDTARLVERVGSRTVIAPVAGRAELADTSWDVRGMRCEFRARHANDGPVSAYVIGHDGSVRNVVVRPATTASPIAPSPSPGTDPPRPVAALLPPPRAVTRTGDATSGSLHLVGEHVAARRAWKSVVDLVGRLDRRAVLVDSPSTSSTGVECHVDPGFDRADYRLEIAHGRASVTASTEVGFRHGFVTAAQWLQAGGGGVVVDDGPARQMRVVHLDVARRWYEPEVVLRLIDLAAWRKFDHVHVHLTDDEGWRIPVAGIPRLDELAGTRGHGRRVGPLCGSGPEPVGRSYTAAEIAEWVRRADGLGVTLVPEVDVPGHCHAALAALPELRDPDDRSGAASIQGFVDNALVPGHPRNDWFIDAVFAAVADLFPTSPFLHIGGDEVPDDAWTRSPIARRWAAERGVDHAGLYRAFVSSLIERVRAATGRRVGAWEEAATSGAMRPDDGYVVSWTSPDAATKLAEAGFDVVASAGQAYYLDMASSADWDEPGASWAGHVPLERTIAFDPSATWSAEAQQRLLGVQACIWSEHVASLEILDRLVFPRLDAIATSAWCGHTASRPVPNSTVAHPRFVATSPGVLPRG